MGLIEDIKTDLDRGAWRLVAEYRDKLLTEATKLCNDASYAEDLVSQTMDKAIRNIRSCQKEECLFAWMKTILTNIYRDGNKRMMTRKTQLMTNEELEACAGGTEDTIEQIEANSDYDALRQAISELDEDYKKTISLYYFNGLPVKDIAVFMKTSTSTVSYRLAVAHRIIAAKLKTRFNIVKKPMAVLAALLLGISTLFGGWKAAEALGWLSAEEAPRTEEAQLVAEEEAAKEETAEAQLVVEGTISSDSNLTQEKGTTTMNLKAVKSVAAAAATALTLSASAEPVTPAIPASAYIQDGLIAHWDGIENAGTGTHDPNATTWTNLVPGTTYNWSLVSGKYEWEDNAVNAKSSLSTSGWLATMPGVKSINYLTFETLAQTEAGLAKNTGSFFRQATRKGNVFLRPEAVSGYLTSTASGQNQRSADLGGSFGDRCSVSLVYSESVDDMSAIYKDGISQPIITKTYGWAVRDQNMSLGGISATDTDYVFKGRIYTIRLYNRALSAAEIALNAAIDKVRFEGVDPSTIEWPDGMRWNSAKGALECRVTVTSTAANPVSINNGAFVAETNAWCELGASVTVKCQVADGYRLARWEGAPKDATVGENQVTFTAGLYAISPVLAFDMPASMYIQNGLIAHWDGIENAGIGQHDNEATTWKDLVGSRDLAVNANEAFSEDCLVLTSSGSHITSGWALNALTFEFRLMQTSGSVSIRRWDANPWQQPFESWSSSEGFLERIGTTRLATTVPVNGSVYHLVTRYSSSSGHRFQSTVNGETTARSGAANITVPSSFNFFNGDKNVNAYAIRIYDRELTDDEIVFNTNVDQVRYEYANPATLTWPEGTRWNSEKDVLECLVKVTSTAANPISVNDGVFVAATNAWCEMGAPVTVKCQVGDAYRLVRWDGVPADAVLGENQVTFSAGLCTISPVIAFNMPASAYVQAGLIAQWDALENAGAGQHDNTISEWVNLKDVSAPMTLTGDYAWSDSSIAFNMTEQTGRGTFVAPAIPNAKGRTIETAACPKSGANGRFFGESYLPGLYLDSSLRFSIMIWGGTSGAICERSVFDPINHFTTYGVSFDLSTQEAKTYFDGAYYLDKTTTGTPTYKTALTSYLANNTSKNAISGDFYALRIYDRVLTDAEVAINATIDKIRYQNLDPTTAGIWPAGVRWQNGRLECLVTVISDSRNLVSLDGQDYKIEVSGWFELDEPVTVYCQAAKNYRVHHWNGVPAGAVQGDNQITIPSAVCTMTPFMVYDLDSRAYVQNGLVDQWDGLENVGRGLPHDSSARKWTGLVDGNILDFESIDTRLHFNENSLQRNAGAYSSKATCATILTNDFTVFDGFAYENAARTTYAPFFGSHSRIIWAWTDESGATGIGFSQKKAYLTSLPNPAGNISIYAAYNQGTGIPSAAYVNGEQLTEEIAPSPTTVSSDANLMVGSKSAYDNLAGGWYALRLYNRDLTDAEREINRLVDKIRYELYDPANVSTVWPAGTRFNNGTIETQIAITFESEKGSVTVNGVSVSSGEPVWVALGQPTTIVATPKDGNWSFMAWRGYYFDRLSTFERKKATQVLIPNAPTTDLEAQFRGSDEGVWNVPGHFDTLAEALASDKVIDGDTIHLRAGIHSSGTDRTSMTVDGISGLKVFANVDKALIIEGEGTDQSVIDCNGNGTLLINNPDATLRNLSISNFIQAASASQFSATALFVSQGLATNIYVDGRLPYASTKGFTGNLVVISREAKLCDSLFSDIRSTNNGGAIVHVAGGTMCHCIITNCQTVGGVNLTYYQYTKGTQKINITGVIENCEICNNTFNTSVFSYDIYAIWSISKVRVVNNSLGKLLTSFTSASSGTIKDCTILNNRCLPTSNQSYLIVSDTNVGDGPLLKNCLIASNELNVVSLFGIVNGNKKMKLVNCTAACNPQTRMEERATVLLTADGQKFNAINTIFADNILSNGTERTVFMKDGVTTATATFSHCRYPEAAVDDPNGNISAAPLFKNPRHCKFMLNAFSPCIDKGDNLDWDKKTDKDLLGQPRIQHKIIDMGCYEAKHAGTVFFIR